jgi:hypothetical protein
MVGTLREALGVEAPGRDGLVDFDTDELEVDYDYIREPQSEQDLTDASLYMLRHTLSPASTDVATDAKLEWLAAYGAQQAAQAQSARDVLRFLLALDDNPAASPHSLVSRIFARAQQAKAYNIRKTRSIFS